jgi:hypothetical protein
LGFGVGLHIGPLGEDYHWIDMLQRGPGAEAARLLWSFDYRNPLSPWWYIAARDLILNLDAGLLVLRYAIATLLAFSSYLLVITIAGRRARPFALGLAVLILFWMANRYPDHVVWNFQGALAASILTVATYARFLTHRRQPCHLYAASLVLWFIAFATYTVQCGAVLAIGYLALRDALSQSTGRSFILPRLGRAATDIVPYVVLFGLFILIWQTTMGPLADDIALQFHASALFGSLREGLSGDVLLFYLWALNSPHRLAFVAAAAACSGLAFLALQLRGVWSKEDVPGITGTALLDLVSVIACLALPTVLLESSSTLWAPGTRWPMIYQVTTPAFLLALVSAVAFGLPRSVRAPLFWNGAVALAIGIGALFSLGHNRVQNAFVTNETFVRNSIRNLIPEDRACGRSSPKQVLLMLEDNSRLWWRSGDVLSPTIARVWFHGADISFRLVPWAPPLEDAWRPWWRIRFGLDSEGIGNAKVGGGTLSYDQVAILEVRDGTARRIRHLERQDLRNWDVDWARETPIDLSSPLCPTSPDQLVR